LLHVTTSKPTTSALHPVPDDGRFHTISLGLGLDEKHSLEVMIGDRMPRAGVASSSSSSSSPLSAARAAATAGQKRPRGDFSGLLAIQSGVNEPLSLTIRYTPPTTRQDQKATRIFQRYHARAIHQIEFAMRNAKQARLELEAAPETTKPDLVAAALEIHLLTKELNRRRAIEKLSIEQKKTHKWFVVQAGNPTRLLGVPGSPLVCWYDERGVINMKSLDEVVTKEQSVPAVRSLPDPIEGKVIYQISLSGRPMFVASHMGRAYITCEGYDQISVYDTRGRIATVTEWRIQGAGTLTGIAVSGNRLFVADFTHHCIRVLDMEGKQERQFGSGGSGNGQFNAPVGVAIADQLLYVCDSYNSRVQVFELDGTWVRSWGSRGTGEGQFDFPAGIAVQDDEVYVADHRNHRVQVLGLDGRFRRTLGSTGAGKLTSPYGVTVHEERVYVTDIEKTADIENFQFVKLFSVVEGGFINSFSNGLSWPMGLCVDDDNRLLVCDNLSYLMVFQ